MREALASRSVRAGARRHVGRIVEPAVGPRERCADLAKPPTRLGEGGDQLGDRASVADRLGVARQDRNVRKGF